MNGFPSILRRTAPAKINWTLEILGRRADGFHEIDTVMQAVSLADELTLTPLPEGTCEIECDAPDVPCDARNLVWKAWDAVRRERPGQVGGVRVQLVKRIPSGAGLGGGSSDAAAALAGLNDLFHLRLGRETLLRLGASLGSDVPFFIEGGAARAQGRGEIITPLACNLAPVPLVILFPGFQSETPHAYKQLRAHDFSEAPERAAAATSALAAGDPGRLLLSMWNTFDQALPRTEERYLAVKARMREAGLKGVMLSGSGAACFGVADSVGSADRAAARLPADCPGARAWSVFTLGPGCGGGPEGSGLQGPRDLG